MTKIRSKTKLWVTKTGEKIKISEMTNAHLINAIKMLERAHNKRVDNSWIGYSMLSGEMASYYAEGEIDALESGGVEYSFPVYEYLVDELSKRKIKE